MRRLNTLWHFGVLVLLCMALATPLVTLATPNLQINYQGRLTDSNGSPVADGSYNMEFKLHTHVSNTGGGQGTCSGACVFMETLTGTNRVSVSNGVFNVMLGSTTPLTSVNFNQTLYLSVNVGGSDSSPSWDGEMSPRRPLGTVPAAFEAVKLGGLNSSQFLRSDASNATSSASTFVTFNQSGAGNALDVQISGSSRLNVAANGNVGIGTSTPYATLSVVGQVVATNFIATSTAATSTLANKLVLTNLGTSAAGDTALCLSAAKEVRVTSGTDCTLSSSRFKDHIVDLAAGLSEVLRLRPVSFNYTGTTDNHLGLIAEDVQQIEPRLVFYEDDGTTVRGVRYTELTALLTKAIQELSARVDALGGGGVAAVALAPATQSLALDSEGRLAVKELKTDTLCLGGTCITEADLRKILNLPAPVDNSGGGAINTFPEPAQESAKPELDTKTESAEGLSTKESAITLPEAETVKKLTE